MTPSNERNASLRNHAQKPWHDRFRRGACCITGLGSSAERAEADGFPYHNTSLNGGGNPYADPQSKFLAGDDGSIRLTVTRDGKMPVEIKSLKNTIPDRRDFERRERVQP